MASAKENNPHLSYIKNNLITEIMGKLENESFESVKVEHSSGLDGFMSALYTINLTTTTKEGIKKRVLIGKFMRGDVAFRESSKSFIQFANEVFIYAKVLPTYNNLLKEAKGVDIKVEDWVAPSYVAKFGYIEGLSDSPTSRECVLVFENLKPYGYVMGPRLYLSRDHLLKMAKPLGQYHALTYVLRERDDPRLEQFRNEILPLPFINNNDPNDAKTNLWRILYRVAFERFYEYFDRIIDTNSFDKQSADDLHLIANLNKMREKYYSEPAQLLEHLRAGFEQSEEDKRFAVILHGDFNRNNVLFRYKKGQENAADELTEVEDVKMIDFQELRYASPALDISFFMFFNTCTSSRAEVWEDILKYYHSEMFRTLESVLKAGISDEQKLACIDKKLQNYNYKHFIKHYSKFAFYGALICMHFLPWMLCSPEECERISYLFETDMNGEEFHKISLSAGGDSTNESILEVLRFASRMGYMDHI